MLSDAALVGPSAREELARMAPVFREQAGNVAERIIEQIQYTIPEYQRPLEGVFGQAVRDGVEQGVVDFLDRLLGNAPGDDRTDAVFRRLGGFEVAEGRGLEVLHSAFRLAVRVGWKRLAEIGLAAGLQTETMCELAAALFAYVDELSDLSHEGYTAAQRRVAGALERRRKRLLELLVADTPAPRDLLEELASAAAWPLPRRLAVAVVDPPGDDPAAYPDLPGDVLVDLEGDVPCVVLPWREAGGEGGLPAADLRGRNAVVGPPVPVEEAAHSLRWARHLAELRVAGVVAPAAPGAAAEDGTGDADDDVLRADDHLLTLWLLSDPPLARLLSEKAVAPLAGFNVRQRERLAETLLAWIQRRGSAPDIAAQLNIHPQTVRYRMHQLEERYGGRLHDPDKRVWLAAGLLARNLLRKQDAARP
ncbi:PucR C-terminal helix-turn-helix domain-containing protein [Prauserella aidingensis]|uniref:PucR family transcriptional regulator n=1 Tax=Prauserella aidingensis TaxID=387890 RepID=UPI0020A61AD4|nr:helix-turn-helix domain-containing protein [Prauserella aidingensis]MCP2254922.1 PucR C-terminal helix-turn-helix domain-containing protein [Prauserella aidingensis]